MVAILLLVRVSLSFSVLVLIEGGANQDDSIVNGQVQLFF